VSIFFFLISLPSIFVSETSCIWNCAPTLRKPWGSDYSIWKGFWLFTILLLLEKFCITCLPKKKNTNSSLFLLKAYDIVRFDNSTTDLVEGCWNTLAYSKYSLWQNSLELQQKEVDRLMYVLYLLCYYAYCNLLLLLIILMYIYYVPGKSWRKQIIL
jgi:hypothetical protein